MSAKPTLPEIIRRALESRLSDTWTAVPGKVVSYDPVTRTADILPVVRRAIANEAEELQHEDLPIIPNVMVLFPGGGGFCLSWPLAAGDSVDLVVQTLAFAQWRESREVSDPGDLRLHSLGNCIAIPGLNVPPGVPVDADSMVVEIPAGPTALLLLGADATSFVALKDLVEDQLQRLKDAITNAAVVAGDGGASFKAAILTDLNTTPVFPENVGATKVKAK